MVSVAGLEGSIVSSHDAFASCLLGRDGSLSWPSSYLGGAYWADPCSVMSHEKNKQNFYTGRFSIFVTQTKVTLC